MASKPFAFRWRDAVMDDPHLTWRAKASAMPLVRHADTKTGHNCFPGAQTCADQMSVSTDTIERGWAELVAAGYLELRPLAQRYRKSQGA
jgi:Helix-turn-helix domain